MALEGSLSDFGLADILQLIFFQRKTGVLTLEGRLDKIRLIFFEGNIGGAESRRRLEDNRLGKVLLKKGLIGESDLHGALEEQKKTGTKLGHILIKKGLVAREAIEEMLKAQCAETVIQLFDWKQGTYEFAAQDLSQDRELAFSLDTQHLLMEGLRISDEWSLIKGKIKLDSLFKKKTEHPSALTREEEELFGYIDGENDVSTIIDLSGGDSFRVSKTLLALAERGIIEAVEAPSLSRGEPLIRESEKPAVVWSSLPSLAMILALVLSLVVVIAYRGVVVKEFRAAETVADLRFRIEAYRVKNATYPPTLEEVSDAKDPWGRNYLYMPAGDTFSLLSAGPDGRKGTQDDIY
jgi:Domain of unknown function (DUF4388)/Type II secretion system (T2SS), protein G